MIAVPLRDARSDATLVERFVAALGLTARLAPMMDADALRTVTHRSSGPLAVEASRRLRHLRVPRQVAGHPRRTRRLTQPPPTDLPPQPP
ncbi:hypothetical protein, partial [Escherichia coli]|uniref:hypothetical protein n=1 Tax=Escherichia coli TaxID=562 RepID=UPI00190270C0